MTHYELIPLRCGHIINHSAAAFLYRSEPDGRRFDAPCIAWLLRTPGRSLGRSPGRSPGRSLGRSLGRTLLVDTGPGPRATAPQHYRPTDPDDLLPLELARCSVDPLEIGTVILTHLHNDHVGGAAHFPNATFHVQLQELREAVWPVPFQRPIYEINRPGHIPAWTRILDRVQAHDGEVRLLPGITAIPLPGHTSGSQGVLVDTAAGPHLLPGDLVPLHENWPPPPASPIPNGNHTDLYAYERSFRRLAALNATVLPSHDPRVFDRPHYPQ